MTHNEIYKPISINIEGIEYAKMNYIQANYNITSQRVLLWREGKGKAKSNPLRYIQLDNISFLYSIRDIEALIIASNKV